MVSNGALSMVALLVLGGTRVAYGAMISRVASHETFGTVGLLLAITMIASYLTPAGLGSAIARFIPFSRGAGDDSLARGFHRLLRGASITASVVLGLMAGAFVALVLGRNAEAAIQAGMLTVAYSLYTTEKSSLYGFGRVDRYVRLEMLSSGITLLATPIVIVFGGWYLLPFVIGYVIFVAGARWIVRSDTTGPVVRPGNAAVRELAVYVALASAGTAASAGFLQGTQLLAALFATTSEIAYFAAAVTLITPLYFLPRALSLALFPSMSEAHGAGEVDVVRRQSDLSTRALLAFLAPVIAAGEFLAPEILTIFGGSSYAAGAPVLQIMLGAAFVAVVQVAAVNALSSSGSELRIPVGWAVTGCLTGLAIVAVIGGPMGGTGVALAYLAGTFITAAGPIVVVWRRYRMPWAGSFSRALGVVAVAIVAGRLLDGVAASGLPAWLLHGIMAVAAGLAAIVILRGDLAPILAAVVPRAGRWSRIHGALASASVAGTSAPAPPEVL